MSKRTPPGNPPPRRAKTRMQRFAPFLPHENFPLFPHASGRWAKKVRGQLKYFGPVEDPQAALEKWNRDKDDLLAGRHPRDTRDGATVADCCNAFLASRKQRMADGDLSAVMFADYFRTAQEIVTVFGRMRLAADLQAVDFARLRKSLASTRGDVALGNAVQRVRTVFKYAFDAGQIDRPVVFGPDFRKPSKREMRLARHAAQPRMYAAPKIRKMITAASVPMRAMILLAINCGFGQQDIAMLRDRNVDMADGIIDYPRNKTGVRRRCILWPETVKALRAARKMRPAPADAVNADLIFITRFGAPWVRVDLRDDAHAKPNTYGKTDAVAVEFGKVLKALKMEQTGRGFYALRHSFRTVADEVRDRTAIDCIMGHDDGSVGRGYVEAIADSRLKAVSDHVRRWLFGKAVSR